ncbi:MAG: hypothetical protein FWG13_06285 [Leptospirales bacterium]|nr:hypothetical protein [Leptospirales bacterium]
MDDSIKKAVEFIGLELKNAPDINKLKLIDEAAQKFDLNPLQTEFLTNKFLLS